MSTYACNLAPGERLADSNKCMIYRRCAPMQGPDHPRLFLLVILSCMVRHMPALCRCSGLGDVRVNTLLSTPVAQLINVRFAGELGYRMSFRTCRQTPPSKPCAPSQSMHATLIKYYSDPRIHISNHLVNVPRTTCERVPWDTSAGRCLWEPIRRGAESLATRPRGDLDQRRVRRPLKIGCNGGTCSTCLARLSSSTHCWLTTP